LLAGADEDAIADDDAVAEDSGAAEAGAADSTGAAADSGALDSAAGAGFLQALRPRAATALSASATVMDFFI
jgi:hypothetical protein